MLDFLGVEELNLLRVGGGYSEFAQVSMVCYKIIFQACHSRKYNFQKGNDENKAGGSVTILYLLFPKLWALFSCWLVASFNRGLHLFIGFLQLDLHWWTV